MMQLADAPAAPGEPRSSTSTACRRGGPCPTSPTTTARGCWPPSSSALARPPPAARQRGPAQARARIDELARRRGRMNPRLSRRVAALPRDASAPGEDADGWRWKIDPSMRFGGFGPWRPEWSMMRMPGLGDAVPRRARPASPRRWAGAPGPRTSCPYLPLGGRFEVARRRRPLRPHRAARACRRPACSTSSAGRDAGATTCCTTASVRRSRCTSLRRTGDGRPLPAPAARARRAHARRGAGVGRPAGPARCTALDFTGHGASTIPLGGGYTAEVLMADVDIALAAARSGDGRRPRPRRLRRAADRRRPARRWSRGAVLGDGPGLAGGGPGPGVDRHPVRPRRRPDRPDPWALVELARDVRPPDYATSFARQATQLSGLDVAHRRVRPIAAAVAGGRGRRARRPRHDDGGSPSPLRGARLTGPAQQAGPVVAEDDQARGVGHQREDHHGHEQAGRVPQREDRRGRQDRASGSARPAGTRRGSGADRPPHRQGGGASIVRRRPGRPPAASPSRS